MASKCYDLAIKTGDIADAGTTGEVWFKFEGSSGRTAWFAFRDPNEPRELKHFVRGGIEFGSFDSADLGELRTCFTELRGDQAASWFPQSVELIDGLTSYTWRFATWVRPGDAVFRDDPVRDLSVRIDRDEPSTYDLSVSEAQRVLETAANRWRTNDPTAPSHDQVLKDILAIFEKARLIPRK